MRSPRFGRGTDTATRVAHAASAANGASGAAPIRITADAAAPARRIPDGEVMARATGGVRRRSRRDMAQKLETTAVKTLLIDAGSEASYTAALVASAIWRRVARSALP